MISNRRRTLAALVRVSCLDRSRAEAAQVRGSCCPPNQGSSDRKRALEARVRVSCCPPNRGSSDRKRAPEARVRVSCLDRDRAGVAQIRDSCCPPNRGSSDQRQLLPAKPGQLRPQYRSDESQGTSPTGLRWLSYSASARTVPAPVSDLASHRFGFRTDTDRQTETSQLTYQ